MSSRYGYDEGQPFMMIETGDGTEPGGWGVEINDMANLNRSVLIPRAVFIEIVKDWHKYLVERGEIVDQPS